MSSESGGTDIAESGGMDILWAKTEKGLTGL